MGTIREICRVMPLVVTVLLVLLGGYEAILGFRQLYGFSVSNHSLYVLTGSFYNPGPYMGYLAMVLPVCVYVYVSGCTQILRCAQDDIIKRTSINVLKYSAGIIGLMILCLLPSGMSRSAWVAAVVSVGYVMAMHHREKLSTFLWNHWKGVLTGGCSISCSCLWRLSLEEGFGGRAPADVEGGCPCGMRTSLDRLWLGICGGSLR